MLSCSNHFSFPVAICEDDSFFRMHSQGTQVTFIDSEDLLEIYHSIFVQTNIFKHILTVCLMNDRSFSYFWHGFVWDVINGFMYLESLFQHVKNVKNCMNVIAFVSFSEFLKPLVICVAINCILPISLKCTTVCCSCSIIFYN